MGPASRRGVVLVGAGGHARVVLATLEEAGYTIAAVFDDDPHTWGQTFCGVPVRGPTADLVDYADQRAVIAIGGNRLRSAIAKRFKHVEWLPVVHPSAYVHRSVRLGPGTVVCAGAIIQPETVVGAHTIVNTAASVDHECLLEDYVHLAPGARLAGRIRVEQGALLGIGSVVNPGILIGQWSTVGAGGVVVRDVPPGITVIGVPAKPIDYSHERRPSPAVSERQ